MLGQRYGLLVFAFCLAGALDSKSSAGDYAFYHENVMGTSLELRVDAVNAEAARLAEERVLLEIERLSKIFSGYDPTSELSRWQNSEKRPTAASSELIELLRASEAWRQKSGGAFDVRVEAFSRLWANCEKLERLPSDPEIASVRRILVDQAWRIDLNESTILRTSDCPLSLNAIAKGFIVGKASDAAMKPGLGVSSLLLNVGGDMRVCGEDPRMVEIAKPWDDSESSAPYTVLKVKNRAIATSGRSQRGFRIGGEWYSHIIDPRTGKPVERIAGATVVAPSSADADALATILNVVEPEDGLKLVQSTPGAECLILLRSGRAFRSPGFEQLESPPSPIRTVSLQKQEERSKSADGKKEGSTAKKSDETVPWDDRYELVVSFEINAPKAERGRYRRPFVAVWAVDKNGISVRTMALWLSVGGAGGEQWLPDLKRWRRDDEARRETDPFDVVHEKNSVARPTRPPGKYRVVWDGKDDKGKPLPGGEYTILIDAAREHGTYQNIRKKVLIVGKPFKEELTGGVEIKSATIDYRLKGEKPKAEEGED